MRRVVIRYLLLTGIPWSNAFWPGLTPFGPLLWQAEADTELTLVCFTYRRYSTILIYRKSAVIEFKIEDKFSDSSQSVLNHVFGQTTQYEEAFRGPFQTFELKISSSLILNFSAAGGKAPVSACD